MMATKLTGDMLPASLNHFRTMSAEDRLHKRSTSPFTFGQLKPTTDSLPPLRLNPSIPTTTASLSSIDSRQNIKPSIPKRRKSAKFGKKTRRKTNTRSKTMDITFAAEGKQIKKSKRSSMTPQHSPQQLSASKKRKSSTNLDKKYANTLCLIIRLFLLYTICFFLFVKR